MATELPESTDPRGLSPTIYDHLRAIANVRMKGERAGHTLQATALVNEAYLRLLGSRNIKSEDKAQFYAAAAEAMRRILIEHARSRGRVKRGGDASGRPARRLPINVLDLADEATESEDVERLDAALTRLEARDPRAATVVQLRFFAGLNTEETAEVMTISRATVEREWVYARARLRQWMESEP